MATVLIPFFAKVTDDSFLTLRPRGKSMKGRPRFLEPSGHIVWCLGGIALWMCVLSRFVSDSLPPCVLQPAMRLCPRGSLGTLRCRGVKGLVWDMVSSVLSSEPDTGVFLVMTEGREGAGERSRDAGCSL